MEKVIAVKPLTDGVVFVEMMSGRSGEFDVTPYMESSFFSELKNVAYFNLVRIFFGGIGWPNGQDIGPDTVLAGLRERTLVAD